MERGKILGPSQRTIFRPRPPPLLSILYMTIIFQQISIHLGLVRLRHFLGRALQQGQARGTNTTSIEQATNLLKNNGHVQN